MTIQKELTGDTGNYYSCMLPNLADMKIKILTGSLIRLSNCLALFIQLVWYILKQLFTSTSVNNC